MESNFRQKPPLTGTVNISVKFENQFDYLKWKQYVDPYRKWDFEVSYPAIMHMTWEFKNSLEVDMLARKIVQLLEMGFDVHSANWRINRKENNSINR